MPDDTKTPTLAQLRTALAGLDAAGRADIAKAIAKQKARKTDKTVRTDPTNKWRWTFAK